MKSTSWVSHLSLNFLIFCLQIELYRCLLLETINDKLSFHLQVNGLSKEDMVARGDLALELGERIKGIPDGSTADLKAASENRNYVKFDIDEG